MKNNILKIKFVPFLIMGYVVLLSSCQNVINVDLNNAAPQTVIEGSLSNMADSVAVVLSLIAIAAYLWVRFGSLTFGLAGIIALYHDVAIALAGIFVAHHLWDTSIGRALMLRDFRIDLNSTAALLTIVGFSINDTIVIFDRVRENMRGMRRDNIQHIVNVAVNQTLGRTILRLIEPTSGEVVL